MPKSSVLNLRDKNTAQFVPTSGDYSFYGITLNILTVTRKESHQDSAY